MSAAYPAVIPMIAYEDGPAAIAWLSEAFGFRERPEARYVAKDGTISHAELETDEGGVIMLATPTPAYQSPRHHRQHCAEADRWLKAPWVIDGALVFVSDIEAHYAQAQKAGATMLSKIEDGPDGKLYRVEDFEGHRWMFEQR